MWRKWLKSKSKWNKISWLYNDDWVAQKDYKWK